MLDVLPMLATDDLAELQRIQSVMSASGKTIDLSDQTFHHFSEGVYGRELRIPAGIAAIGKIHRHSTMNILAAGELVIATPDGPKTLTSPAIFVSPAGCKKLVYAVTDCVLLNVHASKETELDRLEAELIEPEDIALPGEVKWLG